MEEKKQVHFFIPTYLHKLIKLESAKKEISITKFIIEAILKQLSDK